MHQTYRDFTIRDWRPGDRGAAAQVIGNALQEFGLGWEPNGADVDALQVEQHYQAGAFWVVEKDGDIVATAAFHPIDRGRNAVEIRKMYLKPEARRQGLGRYLLQQLEADIAARGFEQIWLETATALKGAVEFYEALGYRLPRASDISGPDASDAPLAGGGCTAGCTGNAQSAQNAQSDALATESLIETERCDRVYIKQLA